MLFFGVLPLLLVAVSADSCYNTINNKCKDTVSVKNEIAHKADNTGKNFNQAIIDETCTSVSRGFMKKTGEDLSSFANGNIQASFHVLMISSYFDNFNVNREGFKKLYRHYSDKLWEDAIHVMKYLAKRGFEMDFAQAPHGDVKSKTVALEEINSLAMVLDIQKALAENAHTICHSLHTKDPTTVHYMQERFLEPYTERIWEMASYVNELKDLSYSVNYTTVTLFLFDEYLQKTL